MTSPILVATSDPFDLQLLSEVCGHSGYEVLAAADGREVLAAVARERPRLVIMDIALPVMNGFEVLRVLKGDADVAAVPVLLATPEDDLDGRRRGLELGAEDYITKPFRVFEIEQRIRKTLMLQSALSHPPAGRRVSHFDVVDPSTGAGTSNQFHISLDYEFTRAIRYQRALGCIVACLSNYSEISETSGHGAAERAMVALAGGLRRCVRSVDHLFRSRPDEFAILLPETDPQGCRAVVARLNGSAQDMSLFGGDIQPKPVLSVGFAGYPQVKAPSARELYGAACGSTERGSK